MEEPTNENYPEDSRNKLFEGTVHGGGHVDFDGMLSAYAGQVPTLYVYETREDTYWDPPTFFIQGPQGKAELYFRPNNRADIPRTKEDLSRFVNTVINWANDAAAWLDIVEKAGEESEDDAPNPDTAA